MKDQFHMDPEQRALYLFCGRRCDRELLRSHGH
ncbi:transposase [Anaerostipes hadrus]|nr:transposase [Anaerostipes hadrus]